MEKSQKIKGFLWFNSIFCCLVTAIKFRILLYWLDHIYVSILRLSLFLSLILLIPQLILLLIAAILFLAAVFYEKGTFLILKAGALTELFCGISYAAVVNPFLLIPCLFSLSQKSSILFMISDILLTILGIQGLRKKID